MTQELFMAGHTVGLRPPTDEDVVGGRWHHWYNDPVVTSFNRHGVFPVSMEDELRFVQEMRSRRDSMLFSIIDLNDGRLVGNASLQSIDLINRHCRIALTIGEPTGLSAGVEVFGLLIEHAFCRLNLNRVGDSTHQKLAVFVRMLSVLGFQQEGITRQYFFRNGNFWDAISYGIVASTFFELRAARGGRILFEDSEHLMRAILSASKG